MTMIGACTNHRLPIGTREPWKPVGARIRKAGYVIAWPPRLWQGLFVRKSPYQTLLVALGMVAMLVSLVAMPLVSTYALAMAGMAPAAQSSAGEMPCHKPGQPEQCPDCPQKVCPGMGTCLVKCFQPLSPPATAETLQAPATMPLHASEPAQVAAGALIPPLLRPPSV
jgi:hypothetical protein